MLKSVEHIIYDPEQEKAKRVPRSLMLKSVEHQNSCWGMTESSRLCPDL